VDTEKEGEMKIASFIESVSQDIRFAVRTLRKNVVLSAVAILTVALGTGINTGVFTVVNAVLLRALPYKDSDRLVWIWSVNSRAPLKQRVSYPDFLDWRARSQTLENFVGRSQYTPVLTGIGEPQRLRAELILGDLFTVLGVSPLLGTVTEAEKDRLQEPSVVLSYNLWQRVFQGDANVIGRRITLDGLGYTVAAVMPPDFEFPIQSLGHADAWVRLQRFNPALADRRDARLIEVMARLKPGIAPAQAQAEMESIASSLSNQYPETNAATRVQLVSAKDEVTGNNRVALLTLFGAVACVLMISCVNVANLQLAKAAGRRSELVMRGALGASRGRIAQQLAIESVLIGSTGGIIGTLTSFWSLKGIKGLLPAGIPRVSEISVDWYVLGFAAALSIATGLVFGIVPAVRFSKIGLSQPITGILHGGAVRNRGKTWSTMLVATEIALAMLLLTGAGLFVKTFWHLNQAESGFDPHQVLTFEISLPSGKYRAPGEAFEKIQTQLRAIPGVTSASVGIQLPDRGEPIANDISPFFEVEGRPAPPGARPRAGILTVQPGYFRTLRIRLLKGRDFDAADRAGAHAVIVINESLARVYFPNDDPLGQHLKLDSWVLPGQQTAPEIVGVAADVKHSGVTVAQPLVYASMAQFPRWSSTVSVRTAGDPLNFAAAVIDAVRSFDRDLPIDNIEILEKRIALSLARERFNALLVSLFSLIALALAVVGLSGVLCYEIEQRTKEIGIRIAIGAKHREVLALILAAGMKMSFGGVIIGILGSFAITRLIRGLLFNVSATDTFSFLFAGGVLLFVAALASCIVARRATQVDPVVALRHE